MHSTLFVVDPVTRRKVASESVYEIRCSVAAVVDEYHHQTGAWCTEAQALAAVLSVPHHAPLAMAVCNVGPLPDAVQVEWFERQRAGLRALGR